MSVPKLSQPGFTPYLDGVCARGIVGVRPRLAAALSSLLWAGAECLLFVFLRLRHVRQFCTAVERVNHRLR